MVPLREAPWLYLMTSPIVLLICMPLPLLNCLLVQIHCHHHLRHAITLNVQTNPRRSVSEREPSFFLSSLQALLSATHKLSSKKKYVSMKLTCNSAFRHQSTYHN